MKRKYKYNKFSEKEKDFMLVNRCRLNVKEIAKELNLSIPQVRGFYNHRNLSYIGTLKVFDGLSPREKEVLCYVGLNSKREIANKLFVSPTTIQSHLRNIFSKLNAHNKADCIVKALKKGIITVEELVEV